MSASLDPKLFRHEDIAGIDIGDRYISAARIARHRKRIEILNAGCVEYDDSQPDRVIASTIHKLWQEIHMPTYTVCSCLRSKSIVQKHFSYQGVTIDELEPALKLEAEETLQLDHQEILFDYYVNPESTVGGDALEGALVAAPKKEVDRHLAIMEMAGLYPVIMEVGSLAVCNLYRLLRKNEQKQEAVCIANLSRHSADIVLVNGEFIYPRTILSTTVALEDAAQYLTDNISDGLRYCQFKLRKKSVSKLIVTGDVPFNGGFRDKLHEIVELPIEFWNPLDERNVTIGRQARKLKDRMNMGSVMSASFGSALRKT